MLGCARRFKAAAAGDCSEREKASTDLAKIIRAKLQEAVERLQRAGGPESYVMSSAVSRADLSTDHAEED